MEIFLFLSFFLISPRNSIETNMIVIQFDNFCANHLLHAIKTHPVRVKFVSGAWQMRTSQQSNQIWRKNKQAKSFLTFLLTHLTFYGRDGSQRKHQDRENYFGWFFLLTVESFLIQAYIFACSLLEKVFKSLLKLKLLLIRKCPR